MTNPQKQHSATPIDLRDEWQTPQYVFDWAHKRFDFEIDLACRSDNKKCNGIEFEKFDSLKERWLDFGYSGWANPPYSNTTPWLKKGYEESQEGFQSVFLIPTPNGETQYRDHVFGKAAEIIYINGRLAFVAAGDYVIKGKEGKPDRYVKKGDEVSGNSRGSCFVVYRPFHQGQTSLSWVDRDDMKTSSSHE